MVKSLANELTEILEWIEDAGLGDSERARAALITFCRGLVCGLRTADSQSKEECPQPTNILNCVQRMNVTE